MSLRSQITKKLPTNPSSVPITPTMAACNTVKGVGRDIESVGEAGSRAI